MFDHMQVSTTTISTRTLFPVPSVPCPSSHDHPSSTCSYAIGPLAPSQITRIEMPLPDGTVFPLLVPVAIPRSLLDAPAFRAGYGSNYLSEEESAEDDAWTLSVLRLVNGIFTGVSNAHCSDEAPSDFPWAVGWLLRDLTRVAERDATLAAVGMAHLCFLLPVFPQPRPTTWLGYQWYDAYCLHVCAVKAYRERVRVYREQGKSYEQAQRLALVGTIQ